MHSLFKRWAARVDVSCGPDACWTWTGGLASDGYGQIRSAGRKLLAHRLAWEFFRGPIPKGEGYHGTCVLHRCDVPACVNPDHMFLGTHAENMTDKTAKGRCFTPQTRGERNGSAKLTEVQVAEIRRRRAAGEVQQRIADDFAISQTTVSGIVLGKLWRHVTPAFAAAPASAHREGKNDGP